MMRRLGELVNPHSNTSWRGDPMRDKSQQRPIENESQRQKIVEWCQGAKVYYESVLPTTYKRDTHFIKGNIHLLTSIIFSAIDKHPTFYSNQLVTAAMERVRCAYVDYESPDNDAYNNREHLRETVNPALEIMDIGEPNASAKWKKIYMQLIGRP